MISTVDISVKGKLVSWRLNHTFPNKSMLENTLVSWALRTSDYTAQSFADYVNSKGIGITAFAIPANCEHHPFDREIDEAENQICGICGEVMKTAEELYGNEMPF
jgi:hypothetical protein